MLAHTRALIAASAFAFIKGGKVAGLYDHTASRHLRIAAEARGESLQGFDGDRSAKFGGTLPELYDASSRTYISMEIAGATAQGFDRGSSNAYTANVGDGVVQLYDHGANEWFAFAVQIV